MIKIEQVWDDHQDIPTLPEGEWGSFEYNTPAYEVLNMIDELLKSYNLEVATIVGHGGTFTEFAIMKRDNE